MRRGSMDLASDPLANPGRGDRPLPPAARFMVFRRRGVPIMLQFLSTSQRQVGYEQQHQAPAGLLRTLVTGSMSIAMARSITLATKATLTVG